MPLAAECQRRRLRTAGVVADAALGTGIAAVVDLRLVPPPLTPGFEHRVSPTSLVWVYASFAVGLALGGLLCGAGRSAGAAVSRGPGR